MTAKKQLNQTYEKFYFNRQELYSRNYKMNYYVGVERFMFVWDSWGI